MSARLTGAATALLILAAGAARAEAVYVTNGSAIDEYSLSGQLIRSLTAPESGGSAFTPGGLAFGADGKLYAADSASHSLAVFDPGTGAFLGNAGSVEPNDSSVSLHGLASAPGGNFVGLTNQNQVFTVDPVTNVTTVQSIDILNSACCGTFLAVDATGRVIGSGNSNDGVYDISGQKLIASLQPDVTGVAFGPSGDIFAVNGNEVDRIGSGGVVTTFASSNLLSHDGNGGDLAFDSQGDLWVTSTRLNLLLEFSSAGALINDFCTGANGSATCGGSDRFLTIGPDTSPNTGVPEPSVWAMLGLGFGAAGAMLRAQRLNRSATA